MLADKNKNPIVDYVNKLIDQAINRLVQRLIDSLMPFFDEKIAEAMQAAHSRPWLTPVEAARIAVVKDKRIYDACERGDLFAKWDSGPGRGGRGHWEIMREDLDRWIHVKPPKEQGPILVPRRQI